MGAKRKRKKERAAELKGLRQDLLPGDSDQTRPCSIDYIRAHCEGSDPDFFAKLADFISKHREGDLVEEFCGSEQSWREHMGSSGYRLSREGQYIACLLMKMN